MGQQGNLLSTKIHFLHNLWLQTTYRYHTHHSCGRVCPAAKDRYHLHVLHIFFPLPLQPHNYPYQLSCDVLVGHLEPCAGLFCTYLEYIYYRSLLLTCRRGALLHASKAKHLGFTGFWEVGKRHNKPPTQSQYPLLLPALLCSESLSVQSPHWCLHSGVSHAWSPLG